MSSVATPVTRHRFDEEVAERLQDRDDDLSGWFCVATAPFRCAAEGCDFVAEYMTAAHLIVVWPERDDPRLLHHAGLAKRYDRDPRVVEYEAAFGPCIPFDLWVAAGRPIHGRYQPPEGWPK